MMSPNVIIAHLRQDRKKYNGRIKYESGERAGARWANSDAGRVAAIHASEKPSKPFGPAFDRKYLLRLCTSPYSDARGEEVFGELCYESMSDPEFLIGFVDGLLGVWHRFYNNVETN